MAYSDHFKLTDDLITHINSFINSVSDPFIVSRYIGFISVASVTVYELAIKEIFIEFGQKKHRVLGNFSQAYFERINGKIKIKSIKEDYIKKYGDKYVNRFSKKTQKAENYALRNMGVSIISAYNNIIEWRNQFAHEGTSPSTVTFQEIVASYNYGKEIIKCLYEAMKY